MGTPPSSLNCLLSDFFRDFAVVGDDMRVPSPAAGTITNTFIRATSIVQSQEQSGLERPNGYFYLRGCQSATRSSGTGFFAGSETGVVVTLSGGTASGAVTTPLLSWRPLARSSHLPKIILPAVVCRTEVTEMSIVLPIILRALSITTMVPSSRSE